MASPMQNSLIQTLLTQNYLEGNQEPEQDETGFSMVLDPEVRKRLNIENPRLKGVKKGKEPEAAAPIASLQSTVPVLQRMGALNIQSPEDRARAQDAYIQFKDLLAQQEQGIEKQNAAIDSARKENHRARFNPFFEAAAAMGDAIYGGDQAKDMRALSGASPEERAKLIADMEAKVNGQRSDMSSQVKSLISEANNLRIADMAAKNNRFAQGQDMRINMAYNKEINDAIKPVQEMMVSIGSIEDAMKPDANGMVNMARVSQALAQAARLNGEKGVLTDQDIARQLAPTLQSHLASMSRYLKSDPNDPGALVPAASVSALLASIQQGKQLWGGAAQRRVQLATDKFVRGYGMRPEVGDVVNNQLIQPMLTNTFANPQTQAPPVGGNGQPLLSKEEFLKQLRGK